MREKFARRAPLVLFTLLAGVGVLAAQDFRSCAPERVEGPARCGRITVPENHVEPGGRQIELNVVVLPATSDSPVSDALFVLAGGPGQAATGMAAWMSRARRGPWADRDLVFVDQRGTGQSTSLACAYPESTPKIFGDLHIDDSALIRCLERVAHMTDPRRYTTTQSAHDLDAVRAALGYPTINLDGGSYGTRLALEYLRRYPARVRAVMLTGVMPADFRTPLMYARYAQLALDRLFDDCVAESECATAYPSVRAEWTELLARLRATAATVGIRLHPDGPLDTVTFSGDDLAYTVRSMLYGSGALRLPAMIHQAWQTGDMTEFAQTYARRSTTLVRSISRGLHLSTLCAEDVPFMTQEQIDTATAGTYLGDYVIREYRRACRIWPAGAIPPDFHQPVVSDRPTLILSGLRDPTTPAAAGEQVARHLSQSLHVIYPYGGHGFSGMRDTTCEFRIMAAFLSTASINGLDASCASAAAPLPFAVPRPDSAATPLTASAGRAGMAVRHSADEAQLRSEHRAVGRRIPAVLVHRHSGALQRPGAAHALWGCHLRVAFNDHRGPPVKDGALPWH